MIFYQVIMFTLAHIQRKHTVVKAYVQLLFLIHLRDKNVLTIYESIYNNMSR